MKLDGLDAVVANLNKAIIEIKDRSAAGLIRGSMIIRESMDSVPPVIPVDSGNLRSSWFMFPSNVGDNPFVTMGFTAKYAVYVHEMIEAKFKRPGAGAKFFEAAFKRSHKQVLDVIVAEATIR